MNNNTADNLELSSQREELDRVNALKATRMVQLTEVPAVNYCHNCFEDLFIEGQKYCNSDCAREHYKEMSAKGMRI